ncbi:hypothetical protein TNCV_1280921 [Trichonephila clavipes]|nr:hypothetical protein TNCV_1280921 [Trichonephila clavipes]
MKELAGNNLKINKSNAVNESVVSPSKVTVGRFACDVTVQDAKISRNHCCLKHIGKNWILTDLKSSNGTYSGNKRLKPKTSYTLRNGSMFSIGPPKPTTVTARTSFLFTCEEHPDEEPGVCVTFGGRPHLRRKIIGTEIGGLFPMLMWSSNIVVASPPGSKTFWKDFNRRLSFSFWTEVKLSPSLSLNWKVLLDIFSAMDVVSNSSPNRYLWVGLSQKYHQAFFTSRTKPAELRKSVPRRV